MMSKTPSSAPAGARLSADSVTGDDVKTCPSALCEEGALLLGVMTSSGKLAYVQPPLRVDADFVARAKARGRPERTFRFSSPCVEAACPQWTGDHCGIGELVTSQAHTVAAPASGELPNCAIRSSCRWFFEQGRDACSVCPLVIADTGGTGTYRAAHPSADDHLAP
jgi:hypothetical protein